MKVAREAAEEVTVIGRKEERMTCGGRRKRLPGKGEEGWHVEDTTFLHIKHHFPSLSPVEYTPCKCVEVIVRSILNISTLPATDARNTSHLPKAIQFPPR